MSEKTSVLIENMIRWAEDRLGATRYTGWCLSFIEDALEISNDIEIFGGDSAKESSELYADALQKGVPIRGSFVFYDCLCPSDDGLVNWGHCGIGLGDGDVIHAWDEVRVDNYQDIEQLTAFSGDHPRYIGWVPVERVLAQAPDGRMDVGTRIVVLGCPGSGKSTFARSLQERTGLPLIHLDNIWWRADRTHISRDEFDQKLAELLEGERWIIEGDYSRTYEVRVRSCDTVIFLDYAEDICMDSLRGRVGQQRTDIPWVEDRLDPELVEIVRNYRGKNRPVIFALLKKYPDKQAIVFTTRTEADGWLTEL